MSPMPWCCEGSCTLIQDGFDGDEIDSQWIVSGHDWYLEDGKLKCDATSSISPYIITDGTLDMPTTSTPPQINSWRIKAKVSLPLGARIEVYISPAVGALVRQEVGGLNFRPMLLSGSSSCNTQGILPGEEFDLEIVSEMINLYGTTFLCREMVLINGVPQYAGSGGRLLVSTLSISFVFSSGTVTLDDVLLEEGYAYRVGNKYNDCPRVLGTIFPPSGGPIPDEIDLGFYNTFNQSCNTCNFYSNGFISDPNAFTNLFVLARADHDEIASAIGTSKAAFESSDFMVAEGESVYTYMYNGPLSCDSEVMVLQYHESGFYDGSHWSNQTWNGTTGMTLAFYSGGGQQSATIDRFDSTLAVCREQPFLGDWYQTGLRPHGCFATNAYVRFGL